MDRWTQPRRLALALFIVLTIVVLVFPILIVIPLFGMLAGQVARGSFEKGFRALEGNDWQVATAFFEAAVTLERKLTPDNPQARYRSYYGLCVGLARKPPLWMKPGDVCEVEATGLGVLSNPIRDEA